MFEPAQMSTYQLIEPPFELEINLRDFGLGWDFTIKLKQVAENTEQQVQPDNAEKEIPFGYYPNNEFND
jgi:hypothetical protein